MDGTAFALQAASNAAGVALTERFPFAIVGHVAAGLDAAHAAGLIHRDVKPANVMLEGEAPSWHAFLGDFGVVKVLTSEADERSSRRAMTGTGMVIGKTRAIDSL